jgi:hypothetical protein
MPRMAGIATAVRRNAYSTMTAPRRRQVRLFFAWVFAVERSIRFSCLLFHSSCHVQRVRGLGLVSLDGNKGSLNQGYFEWSAVVTGVFLDPRMSMSELLLIHSATREGDTTGVPAVGEDGRQPVAQIFFGTKGR